MSGCLLAKLPGRGLALLATLALGLAGLAATTPARADWVAYVPPSPSGVVMVGVAYLADWKAGNWAQVVGSSGASVGAFTDDGVQKVVTLAVPFTLITVSADVDCFYSQYTVRHETRQLVFRKVSGGTSKGSTQVVEIGIDTALDGCWAGRITPFGSLSDPGTPLLHRAFSARAPMSDVGPAFTIAGFTEGPPTSDYDPIGAFDPLGADMVTLPTANTLRFQRTGTVVPATLNSDQWLILQMPGFQRGFTRVTLDAASGGEIWLGAVFDGGSPVRVGSVAMIKPVPGTTFGSVSKSSRMWESSIGLGTDFPNFRYLYRDKTGELVSKDLTTGDESRSPLTWQFSGTNIVQSRDVGTSHRERTWTPLARNGKYLFLFEQESRTDGVGIPPRVNFYVDRGPAYPP